LKNKNNISFKQKLLKYTAALVMCGCLLFLTGVNFFVYGQAENKYSVQQCDNNSSKGESSDGEGSSGYASNLTIEEEYVHESHVEHQLMLINKKTKYALLDEEKNYMVHFELIAPPPDL